MKLYLKELLNKTRSEPMVFAIGLCVFLLAVMGTSVHHVSSVMFGLLFLLSFSVIKKWPEIYRALPQIEKYFLMAFFIYMVAGALAFYNADDIDKYIKLFERYLRFLMIVPVYLLIVENNKSILKFLQAGAILSGPFLFFIAARSYLQNPDVPAQGYYHHIIFGQLAMLNVGIMLGIILTKSLGAWFRVLIIVSMLCGTGAAVLSQARGVWMVFPIYLLITIIYLLKNNKLNLKNTSIFVVIVILLTVFTPAGDLIKKRSVEAVTEVSSFYTDNQYISSVGTRLAMWDVAIFVWKKHPVLGTGPGDFDDEVLALQKNGEYIGMQVHNSVHNVYIQALVGAGVIGLAALLLAVIIMPLRVFFDKDKLDAEGRLAGFITIASFSVYGMSESWTLRLSSISIFLVYTIVIASHMRIVQMQNNNNRK